MSSKVSTVVLFLVYLNFGLSHGFGTWMNLGMQGVGLMNELDPMGNSYSTHTMSHKMDREERMREKLRRTRCKDFRGLSKGQFQLCHLYREHIPYVGLGARMGIEECQWQFKNSRWNCSVVPDSTVFGPLLNQAGREAAFAHAVSAAGVVHKVASACREGRLPNCGCSQSSRPKNLQRDWIWGGCGDNIEYGYRFAETFVDVRELERSHPRSSKAQGRKLMNLHNNEAGRRSVIRRTRVTCKCHGVSGSCSLVTCWQQLSSFREIGDFLKDKYDGGTEVKINRRGKLQVRNRRFRLPTAEDLIFVDESPDFCATNTDSGSFGTKGRACNRTSDGTKGCNIMCCGRGYNTHKAMVKERCNCRFNWCCWVQCETCTFYREIHTCK